MHWVDENLLQHEEMYPLGKTSGDHIILVIKDILMQISLKTEVG